MTIDQQMELAEKIFQEVKEMLYRKGNDYSASSDRLSNFKQTAAITGTTPERVVLTMCAIKVSRLGNLLEHPDGVTPQVNNESIKDSWEDLLNYALLGVMCRIEALGNEKTPVKNFDSFEQEFSNEPVKVKNDRR